MRQFTFSGIEKFVLHQKSFIFVDLQKIIFVRHFWCCSGNNATQGLLRRRNPTCSCFFHSCLKSFRLNSKPSTKPRRKEESHPNRDMILLQLLHQKECNIKFSAMAFVGFVQIVAAKPRQRQFASESMTGSAIRSEGGYSPNKRLAFRMRGKGQILRQILKPLITNTCSEKKTRSSRDECSTVVQ